MPDTTLEEARRCPKCAEPGAQAGEMAAPHGPGVTRGARLHKFVCGNIRCRWYDQIWMVQVNPDGTIPPPTTSRRNSLIPLLDDGGRTRERLLNQLGHETSGGGEIYQ
jgi:hypothetical protein